MAVSEVVVVTGASAGVGRAIARAFAERGARIGLIARGEDALVATKREVEKLGGRAIVLPLDVADADAVDAAAERVEREFGPIDVWVNNAMVSVFSPALDMTADEFQRVTNVTYLGYVWGTLAALRRMKPRDHGTIIQVGSALSYRAIPLQSAYCAAKHAIKGFTESLRCELLHDESKVRLSMVHLPAINTPQFGWSRSHMKRRPKPMGRVFQPEVAAEAVLHAADNDRRELWVGGPTVTAIVAERVVPGILDRHLGKSGYEGQQTAEPTPRFRRDNLFEPVNGDHGAHGRFDREAKRSSLQLALSKHKNLVGYAVAVGGGALALVLALLTS